MSPLRRRKPRTDLMRRLRVVVWRQVVAFSCLLGCGTEYQATRDAARIPDTNVDARDPCAVAGIRRCDPACPYVCGSDPSRVERCISGFCMGDDASHADETVCGSQGECEDARSVCVYDPSWGGYCQPTAFCDSAVREGYPLECIWSGGSPDQRTPYVTGAPTDQTDCPAGAGTSQPFCGEPCVDLCPRYASENSVALDRGVCVGRSDGRQFGLCVPAAECARWLAAGPEICSPNLATGQRMYPELGADCVCLVWRHAATADGLTDVGLISGRAACAAYRTLYPDDIECVVDKAWNTLP